MKLKAEEDDVLKDEAAEPDVVEVESRQCSG